MLKKAFKCLGRRASSGIITISVVVVGLSLVVAGYGKFFQSDAELPEGISDGGCTRIPLTTHKEMFAAIERNSKIELTHPVSVHVASERYVIPWGYFRGRPPAELVDCDLTRKALSLQYWVPSLDFPEADMTYNAVTDSPAEKRHPQRGPDETVVQAVVTPYGDAFRDRRARAGFTMSLRKLAVDAPGVVEENGLWRTTVPESSLQTIYWFRSGSHEDLVIECHLVFERCGGHLDFKGQGLQARLTLNRGAVFQHAAIVDGLRTLLNRWQVDAMSIR